jgi:hypothetical protein
MCGALSPRRELNNTEQRVGIFWHGARTFDCVQRGAEATHMKTRLESLKSKLVGRMIGVIFAALYTVPVK